MASRQVVAHRWPTLTNVMEKTLEYMALKRKAKLELCCEISSTNEEIASISPRNNEEAV